MQNTCNTAVLAVPTAISGENVSSERTFALDTTFVLFFLALDFGQGWLTFGLDGLLAGITLAMFVAIPYLLPFSGEKPDFKGWLTGRIIVAAAGLTLGLMIRQAIGVILPEAFRFAPMTMLMVAAFISCYLQLYGIIRVRLAR